MKSYPENLTGKMAYDMTKSGAIQKLSDAAGQIMKKLGFDFNWNSCAGSNVLLDPPFAEEVLEELRQETPLMKLGTPQDVAEAVFYLSSDAAAFITGAVLDVNGGI